jgi:hypothetical protein
LRAESRTAAVMRTLGCRCALDVEPSSDGLSLEASRVGPEPLDDGALRRRNGPLEENPWRLRTSNLLLAPNH